MSEQEEYYVSVSIITYDKECQQQEHEVVKHVGQYLKIKVSRDLSLSGVEKEIIRRLRAE